MGGFFVLESEQSTNGIPETSNNNILYLPADYGENSQEVSATVAEQHPQRIPQPVTTRLLLLFAGGIGCLLLGVVLSVSMNDFILFILSLFVFATMLGKGFILYRKVKAGSIYSIRGVCTDISPKLMRRYSKTTFIDVDSETFDENFTVLPKKTVFKVGHKYVVYFDRPIRRPGETDPTKTQWIDPESLPTEGFIGIEHLGIYQEAPKKDETKEKADENAAS